MSQQGQFLDDLFIETITGNTGGPVPPISGNINLLGDNTQGIDVNGVPATATLTITAFDATESQKGVVELATDAEAIAGVASTNLAIIPSSLAAKLGVQTQFALAIGNTTAGALNWTNTGTDGQVVIAATGADPAFASLTSTGGTIAFTPGANSLNLEVAGAVATQYDADSGSAVPAANILILAGGDLITTSAAGNTVTFDTDDNVVGTVNTDGGLVTPASHTFLIAGGNNCTTSGAASTVTIDVDGNVADSFPTDSGTATPALGSLTVAGAGGITTSGAGSTVTVDGSAFQQFSWSVETGATHSLEVNTGVFANNGAGVTVSLPAAAAVGDSFQVVAMDAAGFTIDYGTGQSIQVGGTTSTVTSGTIVSTGIGDWVEIVCNVANTDFFANVKQGNVTVT